eukprot:CAMPEP_0197467294 /NCGR_PEP_ID=MMETSP1175-20131217/65491_1 /TAXON_ID=1003142 /ORGANISM="Triceratium dubium, Strain CCMP147" /LENGTH=254 /DNA_ID=CAMNT_0043003361 /DNA_START=117 /DNA_END=881 /DNA_ORIENTATION=-
MKFYLLAIAAITSLPGILARLEGEGYERDLEGAEEYPVHLVGGQIESESGCCYQDWGGPEGKGGCSTADWCNLSKDNCDTCDGAFKIGCCYQDWGGPDGSGGCSTTNWCNLSENNCDTCDGEFYDESPDEPSDESELESVSNLMGKKEDYKCCYQPWGGDGHGGCSTATWCNDSKDNCYSCDGEWKKYKYSDSSKKSKPSKKTEKSKPPKKTKKSETKPYKGKKGCCYQPWGGDGHGGCSTAKWCNYSKKNCDT